MEREEWLISAKLGQLRSWNDRDQSFLIDKATCKAMDHLILRIWGRFGMSGRNESCHIPRKFHRDILKAAACGIASDRT